MKLTSSAPDTAVDPGSVNLLDSRFYAEGDPHALWARLRRDQPLHQQPALNGREAFWAVTRHADVCRVLRSHQEFTSRRGTMLCIVDLNMPDIAAGQMMPDTDPPEHTRLREPLNRALGMRSVQAREAQFRKIALDLLEPALDGEVFDLGQAALMFPMAFAGTLMGIPSEVWAHTARLTTMTIAYDDPDYQQGTPLDTLRQAHHELFAVFHEELKRRDRSDPGDDLIGVLMSMRFEGEPLTDEQILFNCYSLLLGANVTTPHTTSGTVLALAEHPDQYARLARDPALINTCVEEGLRWTSPASHFMRYAVSDIELHGQLIRAGEPVTAWLGSANRDDAVFPDPYTFDVARTPNRHVAFGYGPHFCIGAGLARVALRLFVSELASRVEGIEPAGTVDHLVSSFVAGFKRMPVRLTARPAALPLPGTLAAEAR
ncbi:cytochrome P450 [Streptomyces sp. NPDC001985]|uniref:cytochrome P450 n=1 Tax=Streptomyces sp. NPDC001985 TaxID=3154406 RepID=UPI00332F5BDE